MPSPAIREMLPKMYLLATLLDALDGLQPISRNGGGASECKTSPQQITSHLPLNENPEGKPYEVARQARNVDRRA